MPYTPDGRQRHAPGISQHCLYADSEKLYPDVPVVLGGIEASLRRLTHYDYWKEKLRPSILVESELTCLFTEWEKTITELSERLLEVEGEVHAGDLLQRHSTNSLPDFYRRGSRLCRKIRTAKRDSDTLFA